MIFVRSILPSLVLGLIPLVFPSRGDAAFRPKVAVRAESTAAVLSVNGRLIARFRAANDGSTPLVRAELAAERLRAAIERGLAPGAVGLQGKGNATAVALGDELLMRVLPGDAVGTRVPSLARQWARRLRGALALPALTLSRRELVVPVEETRAVEIGGVATGEIAVTLEDTRVAVPRVDLARGVLVFHGLAPGTTTGRLAREGAEVPFRIAVKQYAGRVTGPVAVEVTGRPAPAELVAQAALEEYRRGVALEPGASARLTAPPRVKAALAPGESRTLSLPVSLGGEGYLPRREMVTLQVRNRPLPPQEAKTLLYSNHPESVHRFGVLYHARVEADEPARLLYHHQNRMGRAFYLAVELVNPGERAARVQVIEGAAKPILDTVRVGHRAGVRYMQRALRDVGTVLEIPAGTRRTVLMQRVAPGRTASGIYGLRPIAGPALFVEVTAATEPVAAGPRPAQPRTAALSEHVYPSPNRQVAARYRVGGHWTFVSLGKAAIGGRHPERRLEGNYGVFYNISVEIENPTADESIVNLVLAPDAGSAAGVFLVEGRFIEVPYITSPSEVVLASFQMKPESRGRVSIRTLPVGGSAYPVTLVVRARRPGEPRHEMLSFPEEASPAEKVTDETPGN